MRLAALLAVAGQLPRGRAGSESKDIAAFRRGSGKPFDRAMALVVAFWGRRDNWNSQPLHA